MRHPTPSTYPGTPDDAAARPVVVGEVHPERGASHGSSSVATPADPQPGSRRFPLAMTPVTHRPPTPHTTPPLMPRLTALASVRPSPPGTARVH
jgi:hypothetical protein